MVHRHVTGWSIAETRTAEKTGSWSARREIQKAPQERLAKTLISNRSQAIRLVITLILIWSAITIPLWYRSGLRGWLRTMTEVFGIYEAGIVNVAGQALILGFLGLLILLPWTISRILEQRNLMSDASLSKLNTVVWPLFFTLAVAAGGWLLVGDSFGRIILLIFMTGWVAVFFHRSFRCEPWPARLGFAFFGGVGTVWLVMFLAGAVASWLMPWKWPWRLLVSLLFAGLFATTTGQAWKALHERSSKSEVC